MVLSKVKEHYENLLGIVKKKPIAIVTHIVIKDIRVREVDCYFEGTFL